MEEPTSSLSNTETEKLFSIIGRLKQKYIGVIYISHRIDEVFHIADRISVFRNGKNRGTAERGHYDEGRIISLMLGHDLELGNRRQISRDTVALEVRNLSIENYIDNFAMTLYKGEILGIAGLMGSGKDELVKSLFGLWPSKSKEIIYEDRPIRIKNPQQALARGIAYLPEERKTQSLFHDLDVKDNIAAIWLYHKERRHLPNKAKVLDMGKKYMELLSIKASSASQEIKGLSGGNQQKDIIARLLAIEPTIMILNDPTRGIDVGSNEEIYGMIKDLAHRGTSIIVVTSELEEIERMTDRVIVLSRGKICGEFADDEVKMSNILPCVVREKHEKA
jgi:ABC-type sugar transport system ATPase subunit